MDCPCCVMVVYEVRPEESECNWPPTPAPVAAMAGGAQATAAAGVLPLLVTVMALVASGIVAGVLP